MSRRRVVKNGGRLIAIDFTLEGMTFLNKMGMIYRYLKTYGKPPANRTELTVDKLQGILENEGFDIKGAKLIGNKTKAIFIIAGKNIN